MAKGRSRPGNASTKRSGTLAAKLDPTKPRAARAASGRSMKPPPVEATVRRAQGALPMAIVRRFLDADLLAQSAALAFYAVLSLAPLLLIVLWLVTQLLPGAQEALGPEDLAARAAAQGVLDDDHRLEAVPGDLPGACVEPVIPDVPLFELHGELPLG